MRSCTAMSRWMIAFAAVCVPAAAGCGPKGAADVQDLAVALRRQGVAYEVSETAALGAIRAEGLRLSGPGLEVELYLVEDEGDMKRALTAAAVVAAGRRATGTSEPVQAYAQGDFFVLVRREPVRGQIRRALQSALRD